MYRNKYTIPDDSVGINTQVYRVYIYYTHGEKG